MAEYKISQFPGSDWAQVLNAINAASPGDVVDFQGGTFEVFSGAQQYFKNGVTYKNGTFTRPDSHADFRNVVEGDPAVVSDIPTVFINCHVQGNTAGQSGDISHQHGFAAHANSGLSQSVYWNNCTSDDNGGDGFYVLQRVNVTGVKITATNNQRSGIVCTDCTDSTVNFRDFTTDGRFDVETGSGHTNYSITARNGVVGFAEVTIGSDATILLENIRSTATTGFGIFCSNFLTGGGSTSTITIKNCDFSSTGRNRVEYCSHVLFEDCTLAGTVSVPTSGSPSETDVDAPVLTWRRCVFTSTAGRPGLHNGCITHPANSGEKQYDEDLPGARLEYHVENCEFPVVGGGAAPIRIWGGNLYVSGIKHKNPYMLAVHGQNTVSRVYDGSGTLLLEHDQATFLEFNPPAESTVGPVEVVRTSGSSHDFRSWK